MMQHSIHAATQHVPWNHGNLVARRRGLECLGS
jgi:hypothetical protein